ncbi:MAG: DUF349 domain-containing protein [Flavobacteriales bacterium]|nr:DUF349 domain-containing protein [Flavobacteriales bacterium]MCB9203823.1 DUF349 domain-containing protein [Flavobacteriales bacterium]
METQEEIITRMEELLEQPVEETMREANELKSSFYALNHQKLEQQREEHRELGARMEDFIPIPNPLEETFKELFSRYRDKKAKFVHQKEEEEKRNLADKMEILKGLKELIDNEESIGKSFDRFKDFQDKWKAVGPVPSDKAADLTTDYKAEVDRFYYNININKELKEYDLAKNLEIRDAIVKKLEELQTAEKIKDIEFILAAAKEEWEEAGPVKPEIFKELNGKYYEVVRALHKKIQDFYTARKDEMQVNLEAKQAMVARVSELAEKGAKSLGKWNKLTEEVLKLQEDWKQVGMVERKFHKAVWDEFRAAQDAFFDKKKAFLGEAREAFQDNKEAKEKLIERAEALKSSEEWKETTEKLKKLQNEWKRIGSAGNRDENKLWGKFRAICDEFFNNKKAWFDGKDDREAANLKAKEEILKKMSVAKLSGSDEEKLAAIKAFGDEFAAIGFVPKNAISKIQKDYDSAIDKLYLDAGLKKDEVKKVRFQNKIERMAEGDKGADQLRKEQNFLSKKLKEKEEELRQYETNMSFFANAAQDNPLLVNAQKNIESLKVEVESLQEKIKLLKISQRKLA